jgi:hypothetical protein
MNLFIERIDVGVQVHRGPLSMSMYDVVDAPSNTLSASVKGGIGCDRTK